MLLLRAPRASVGYITDALPPKQRVKQMSELGSLSGLFFMVGPPIGSFIAAVTPLGMKAPFYFGALTAVLCFAFGYVRLLSPATVMRCVSETPNFKARKRWEMLRTTYTPRLERYSAKEAGSTQWLVVAAALVGSFLSTIIMNVPAIVLALGPMRSIGLGPNVFGAMLMGMGLQAAAIQWYVFTPLQKSVGLFAVGALAGALSIVCELTWMQVGRDACGGALPVPCFLARATAFDVLCLVVGAIFNGSGFMLSRAVISPVCASAATTTNTGFVIGLGASAGSAGRVVGPLIWGPIAEISSRTAFMLATALAAAMGAMWLAAAICASIVASVGASKKGPVARGHIGLGGSIVVALLLLVLLRVPMSKVPRWLQVHITGDEWTFFHGTIFGFVTLGICLCVCRLMRHQWRRSKLMQAWQLAEFALLEEDEDQAYQSTIASGAILTTNYNSSRLRIAKLPPTPAPTPAKASPAALVQDGAGTKPREHAAGKAPASSPPSAPCAASAVPDVGQPLLSKPESSPTRACNQYLVPRESISDGLVQRRLRGLSTGPPQLRPSALPVATRLPPPECPEAGTRSTTTTTTLMTDAREHSQSCDA